MPMGEDIRRTLEEHGKYTADRVRAFVLHELFSSLDEAVAAEKTAREKLPLLTDD